MELEKIIQVTGDNLRRLDKQKYSVDTRRSAHIRELARGLSAYMPEDEDTAEEFRPLYEEIVSDLSLSQEERILLCRYMAEGNRVTEKLLSLQPPKRRCTVSYVKNSLSDLAYERFSECFDKAVVSYAPDFASALEDVYHSVTDYVILPVYSDKAGRMKSFCDMAEKYEMKRVLSCPVYSNADDSVTVFVLFSKNNEILFSQRDRDIRFEFSVSDGDIAKSIICAEALGCRVLSADTTEGRASVCLGITNAEADALCICLMLEIPGHTVSGIYKSI